MIIEHEDVLEHHGVKGMKWGVRNARRDVREQAKTSRKIIKTAKTAKTRQEREAAIEAYKTDVVKRINSKEFREKYKEANTVTKGDIITQMLVFGPILGPIRVSAIKKMSEQNQRTGIDMEMVAARDILKELNNL